MSKIDYENLLNPVGSVWHSQYGHDGLEGRSFNASGNNPLIPMIEEMIASGNYKSEEIADLYDKAYAFEVDQANWISQLKVNEALKLEQREYDSPEAQVKRLRDAGINPDLVNGSSGSGVGSGSGSAPAAAVKPQSPTTRTDPYASEKMVFEGINTAMNVVNSLTALGQGISNMFSQMSLLPSQVKLSEAQAYVADKTKDFAVQSADVQLGNLSWENASKAIQHSKESVGMLQYMSDAGLTIASSDDDYSGVLDLMDITDEDLRKQLMERHKKYLENPAMQAAYQKNVAEMNKNTAYNTVFTPQVVGEILTGQAKLELAKTRFERSHLAFQTKLTDLMLANKIPEQQVDLMVKGNEVQGLSLDASKIALQDSITSMTASIDFIDEQKAHYTNMISEIEKKASDEGRELTQLEIGRIRSYQSTLTYLETQTINEKQQVYRTVQQSIAQDTYFNQNQKDNGKLKAGTDRRNQANEAIELVFQDWYDNKITNREFGQKLYNNIITGVNTASNVANTVSNFLPND